MKNLRRLAAMAALAAGIAAGQTVLPTANTFWVPVTEAEKAMKAPVVEKDAGAEALFWRVAVTDEVMGGTVRRVLKHYIRLKVFNEKGIESASKIDIVYGKDTIIDSIDGRTIKPDGTVVDLKKDSIHQRDLVKSGGRKSKVKTLAMPGVEPGAIVEYRWSENRWDARVLYMKLEVQQDFPVQNVTYYLRPLTAEDTAYRMSVWPFNCQPTKLKAENNGYHSFSLANIPAFHPEPMMPGEPNIRPWVLCLYRDDNKRDPEKYWEKTGKEHYKVLKSSLRATGEMKAAVAAVAGGAPGDEGKAGALLRYMRKNFRNVHGDRVTEAERGKYYDSLPKKRLRTAEEIFKSGLGSADELNTLFAALAAAVGLDARPALIADREGHWFDKSLADVYFLPNIDMAVKVGETWKIYDVSAESLPAKMLTWREEGMQALVTDSRKPVFVEAPITLPEGSTRKRTAKLKLAEDGTLSGAVTMTFAGHRAFEQRIALEGKGEKERMEAVTEEVKRVFQDAVVSDVAIENADDPEQEFTLRYRLSIPGYAVKTGKRLLLEPMYFQRGETPLFPAASRKYPVSFQFGWMDSDSVSIEWPKGYTAEAAAAPESMNFGQTGYYRSGIAADGPSRVLQCSRELVFGRGGRLLFSPEIYKTVKAAFDEVHRRDGVSLVLTQSGGGQ